MSTSTGPPLGIELDANQKKELAELIMREFFDPANVGVLKSEELLAKLKAKNPEKASLFEHLEANDKDDHYGICTLKLKSTPSDLEFRLKTPAAYGGPKTESYLDRIDSKIEAAKKLINKANLSDEDKQQKCERLEKIGEHFKAMVKRNCTLDQSKLRDIMSKDVVAQNHFKEKHGLAKEYLAVFMEKIVSELQIDVPKNEAEIKSALFQEERMGTSSKRAEKISMRQIKIEDKTYYEINVSSPMNKERTVSSSKKDEAGVANWLKSENIVYSSEYEELDRRETFRSASIVPHDIINKGTAEIKKDNFVENLVKETAKRNLIEHVIPELVREYIKKNPDKSSPLQIDFELLTLLSPISGFADKLIDPDKTQFEAMRDAMKYCNGIGQFQVDGYEVQFTGIYHNYGVNMGRGLSGDEDKNNACAFCQVLDRSAESLNSLESLPPFLKHFIKEVTQYDGFSEIDGQIKNKQSELSSIYQKIADVKPVISKKKHEDLLKLHAKLIAEPPLTPRENAYYNSLRRLFVENSKNAGKLQKEASNLEREVEKLNKLKAEKIVTQFMKKQPSLNKQLNLLENSEKYKSKADPAFCEAVDHLRALVEYTQLYQAGYDSKIIKGGKFQKNYEIQSYIEILNRFNNGVIHITCKSGKDRTNAASEKHKAKNMMRLHSGRVPQCQAETQHKVQELRLFEKGYLHGPGNDICGDNMKPGAQQLSNKDIDCDIMLDAGTAMAKLQKGMDELPSPSEKRKQEIQREYASLSGSRPVSAILSSSSSSTPVLQRKRSDSRNLPTPAPTLESLAARLESLEKKMESQPQSKTDAGESERRGSRRLLLIERKSELPKKSTFGDKWIADVEKRLHDTQNLSSNDKLLMEIIKETLMKVNNLSVDKSDIGKFIEKFNSAVSDELVKRNAEVLDAKEFQKVIDLILEGKEPMMDTDKENVHAHNKLH